MALGAGLVLISRGVDLSGGRMVGLAAVVSASMLQSETYSRLFFPDLPALPLILPIPVAVGVTTFLGCVNGVVVARLRVPPFIATLGMMVIAFGMTAIYFDQPPNSSQPISGIRDDLVPGHGLAGTGSGVDPVHRRRGRHGGGHLLGAAREDRLRQERLCHRRQPPGGAGVGREHRAQPHRGLRHRGCVLRRRRSVLEAARTGGASSRYGELYELDAIAACVVGGVSTAGGIGRVRGIVAGVLVFSVISYGLTFIGINPFWQRIIKGVIIIGAVAFDMARNRSRR